MILDRISTVLAWSRRLLERSASLLADAEEALRVARGEPEWRTAVNPMARHVEPHEAHAPGWRCLREHPLPHRKAVCPICAGGPS